MTLMSKGYHSFEAISPLELRQLVTPCRKAVLRDPSNAVKEDGDVGKTIGGIRWERNKRLVELHTPE